LRQAQDDLERINRVTTMGELAASLAHEVSQPICGAVINANPGRGATFHLNLPAATPSHRKMPPCVCH